MLFNSYSFLFAFLPAALAGWWLLRGDTARCLFLTAASYFFYAWWDVRFVALLVATTAIDFAAGYMIARFDDAPHRRKTFLVLALSANVGLLAYFKYVGFFLDSLDGLAALAGIHDAIPSLVVLLPIGISFYTFNSMSYTIDVYRRRVPPATSFARYSAFVAMFPHLVAGPIVRYADIRNQLFRLPHRLTSEYAARGLTLLAIGLFKKLIIADQLAPYADDLFSSAATNGVVLAWSGAIAYSLQLYFDFSGYSDMAIGLALLIGFRFPQNFNSPYQAQNISDFWRRWHMTLSRWMRDYVYIPLGGSHGSRAKTARNLILTMSVAGFWHGAGWTFGIWGLYHGVLLAGHAIARQRGWVPRSRLIARAATFAAVVVGFVIFRANGLTNAGDMLSGMFGLHGVGSLATIQSGIPLWFGGLLVVLVVLVNVTPNSWDINRALSPSLRAGLAAGAVGALAITALANPSPFLYFQF